MQKGFYGGWIVVACQGGRSKEKLRRMRSPLELAQIQDRTREYFDRLFR